MQNGHKINACRPAAATGCPKNSEPRHSNKKATCVTKGVQMQRSEAEMIRSDGVSARRSA